MGRKECLRATVFVVLFVVLFIILPLSFSRVHYYEYGLVQRRSTGKVDRETVYNSGNWMLGPDYTFIKFPATAQTIEFADLSVWTKSSSKDAGTAMLLDLSFQYLLQQEEIGTLYSLVALNYEQLVKNIALNTIKNNATSFSADSWVQNRRMIQDELLKSVNRRLREAAHASCILLQVRKVQFPPSFVERRLDAAIQTQRNAEEAYKQTATITRSTTSLEVLQIQNEAHLIERKAEAEAKLLEAQAENKAKDYNQRARAEGLALVTEAVGISEQGELISLDFNMRLKESKGFKYVNFPFVATSGLGGGD